MVFFRDLAFVGKSTSSFWWILVLKAFIVLDFLGHSWSNAFWLICHWLIIFHD